MTIRTTARVAFLAALLSSAAGAAFAQAPVTTAPTAAPASKLDTLEAEVELLKAQIADLKASTVAQLQDVRSTTGDQIKQVKAAIGPVQPAGTAQVSIAKGAPTIASSDGAYAATFHGVLQFDTAAYDQSSAGPTATDLRRSGPALGASASNADLSHARALKNGDLFRRARLGIDGVSPGFEYRLLFDFGGSGVENAGQLYEGWVQYSGIKPLHIRVGAFAPSLGLADANSTSYMPFLDRPSVEDITRNLAGGDTRTAAQIYGYGKDWFASAAVTGRTVGVVSTNNVLPISSTTTSVTVGTAQTYSDQLGFTGRVGYNPIHDDNLLLHLGVHGSFVDRPANATGPGANGATPLSSYVVSINGTPELRVDGTKLINTGNISAKNASSLGAEFALQHKNLWLAAEYDQLSVDRTDISSIPSFHGYYVEGTWFITGEQKVYNSGTAAFDGPSKVNHNFDPRNGGLGALELALRWSDMDLNYHAGAFGAAQPTDGIRGGDQQIFTAGINWYPNPVIRFMLDFQHVRVDRLSPSATAYLTPVGAQIGQSYNAFALRSQVAF